MAQLNATDLFDRPIPGQSLTRPPKSSPFEHPPQFVDRDKALDVLWDKLTQKREALRIVAMLHKGIPCEAISRTILLAGFMEGKWTVDLVLQMARTLTFMIAAIGTKAGVTDVKIKNPDIEQQEFLSQFIDTSNNVSKTTQSNVINSVDNVSLLNLG